MDKYIYSVYNYQKTGYKYSETDYIMNGTSGVFLTIIAKIL